MTDGPACGQNKSYSLCHGKTLLRSPSRLPPRYDRGMDDQKPDVARFAWGLAVGVFVMSPFILFQVAQISPMTAAMLATTGSAAAGALVIRKIIRWVNWRHEPENMKRPPDDP